MAGLYSVGDLVGWCLQASDGDIGELKDVYFDDQTWGVRYLVVRTGSWLLGREVLIAPQAVLRLADESRHIAVDLTREQVENSPPVDSAKPVSRFYEEQYYRYYGWEPYWTGDPMLGTGVPPDWPVVDEGGAEPAPENPHLRSSHEVRGYYIHAPDGELGHVHDYLLDAQAWAIRYLEVDTRNWWPGKKVLIAPDWIEDIGWPEHEVHVRLSREVIRDAPEYDPRAPITPDYEAHLRQHYAESLEGHGPAE